MCLNYLLAVKKPAEDSDRKLVRAGDFVINSRSDRRGACGISPVDGSCSVINIVIHPRNKQNAKYYSYALYQNDFQRNSIGGDTELLPIYGQLDGASLRKPVTKTLGSGTNKNCGFLRRKMW